MGRYFSQHWVFFLSSCCKQEVDGAVLSDVSEGSNFHCFECQMFHCSFCFRLQCWFLFYFLSLSFFVLFHVKWGFWQKVWYKAAFSHLLGRFRTRSDFLWTPHTALCCGSFWAVLWPDDFTLWWWSLVSFLTSDLLFLPPVTSKVSSSAAPCQVIVITEPFTLCIHLLATLRGASC